MEILSTEDYNQFKFLNGNRTISRKKIRHLKTEAVNGLDLFKYCPIVVYRNDNGFTIIDGQHRFISSQELKRPIYYVICEQLSLVQIAKLNSSNWTNKDYLRCFLKTGSDDYNHINELIKIYRVTYSVACDLIMIGKYKNGKTLNYFREGKFKSNHFNEACELMADMDTIFGRYKFWNHGPLIEAFRQIKKAGKFDMDTLILKIKQAPNVLDRHTSVKEYLFNIERLYNNKNKSRVSIF